MKITYLQNKLIELQKGNVMLISMIFLITFLITIPYLVRLSQQESKQTVKQQQTTTAFQLAEAGLDRGFWKLSESSAIWDTLETDRITYYNYDKIYSDVKGGEYTIEMASHPTISKYRIITAAGRDNSTKEVRKIEAIYEKQELDACIYCGPNQGILVKGNVEVNWGPIKSLSPITLQGAAATNQFPRKYSASSIDPWDLSPASPNTNNLHWWSYYNVPPRPEIDFEIIKASAQANGTYYAGNRNVNNWSDSRNLYWYHEQNLSIGGGGNYIIGKIFVMGNFTMTGSGNGSYTIANLPATAADEYQAIDTSATSEFYGDAGGGPPSSLKVNFQFGAGGNPDKRDAVKDGVSIRGLLYCGGQFNVSGNATIHGALVVDGNSSTNISPGGSAIVFYDDTAYDGLPTSTSLPVRVSWRELSKTWP
ncbi:MAG: hypothetical protein ABII27_00420 [bacterium]